MRTRTDPGGPATGACTTSRKVSGYGFEGVPHDLDRDGDLDVVATGFGQQGQIAWYENSGDPKGPWKKHPLKEHWALGATVIVADMDGDEWPDVVAVNERGLELRWWHNRGPR